MVSEGKGLLEEFQATRFKSPSHCTVCMDVSAEVRAVIEDGYRRGIGSVSVSNFLRKRGLWQWSNYPIETHKRHWQP